MINESENSFDRNMHMASEYLDLYLEHLDNAELYKLEAEILSIKTSGQQGQSELNLSRHYEDRAKEFGVIVLALCSGKDLEEAECSSSEGLSIKEIDAKLCENVQVILKWRKHEKHPTLTTESSEV